MSSNTSERQCDIKRQREDADKDEIVVERTMKGFICSPNGCYVQTNLPIPKLEKDECLIKVHLAGICSTDIQLSKGYKGGFSGILGHEFVGTVVDGVEDWVGARVVASINIPKCSPKCDFCQVYPKGNHCENREVVGIYKHNGAFAQYVSIPVSNLYRVPATIPDDVAVFTEPLAAAFRAAEQIESRQDKLIAGPVAVLGDGKLACLLAQAIRLRIPKDREVIVIGKHEEKLARLLTAVPTISTILFDTAITKLANACSSVVEATGHTGNLDIAIKLVRACGLILMKSTCAPSEATIPSLSNNSANDIVVRELEICGSRCGDFHTALDYLERQTIATDFLVDSTFDLEDAENALKRAMQKGALKVHICMHQN
jgi:threonine dehydrogenase-like Zn-dependent dehydrogenase